MLPSNFFSRSFRYKWILMMLGIIYTYIISHDNYIFTNYITYIKQKKNLNKYYCLRKKSNTIIHKIASN